MAALVATLGLAPSVRGQAAVAAEWTNGLLSLSVEGAPLADAMRAVATVTGLDVHGAESLQGAVTLRLTNVPLGEALRRLLAGTDHVIIERSTTSGPIPVAARFPGHIPFATDETEVHRSQTQGENGGAEDAPGARLDAFLRHPDSATRSWAVERLGDVADQWALSRILVALRDESADVRAAAVRALGHYGPEAAAPLLEALRTEPDGDVRAVGLVVLAQAGGPSTTPFVAEMLSDADLRIRLAAIEALGLAGGTDAGERLRTATADADARISSAALANLGFSSDEAERSVRDALVGNDEDLRHVAADVLGASGRSSRSRTSVAPR